MKNPRFSPDGEEIYVSFCSYSVGIAIDRVPTTGGKLSHVVRMGKDKFPYRAFGISNTLEKIAAVRVNFIEMMGMDAENTHVIYSSPEKPVQRNVIPQPPSFTSDGKLVAFSCQDRDPHTDEWLTAPYVCAISTAGGTPIKLINNADQPCFGRKVSE